MAVSVMRAGVLTPLKAESVMVGGVLRKLKTVKVMRGGALVTVAAYTPPGAQALSAVASPDNAFGFGSGTGASLVTSEPVTAVVSGGAPPFIYSIARVSGVSMTITAPNSATTLFQKTIAGGAFAVFRWTITDSLGAVVTCDCSVQLEKNS